LSLNPVRSCVYLVGSILYCSCSTEADTGGILVRITATDNSNLPNGPLTDSVVSLPIIKEETNIKPICEQNLVITKFVEIGLETIPLAVLATDENPNDTL